ncbi:hypothetical protein H7100_00330 [Candidatus Saccharibacteria bacterium]|nr:hypothetical protein [Candidatus Saccharibacteria bacterium]
MDTRESVDFQPLPGSDALRTAPLFNPNRPLPYKKMNTYMVEGGHRKYLENPAYNHYIHMHKVVVGESGAAALIGIADELKNEALPTYLDAAGWAYAEAGLASRSISTVERIELIAKAEMMWQQSLVNGRALGESYDAQYRYGENEGHRTALNLAFSPLLKSIVVGSVSSNVMQRVLRDTAEIAHDSKLSLDRAYATRDIDAAAFHRGFLFEASALMAMLYMDDPRYVPLPATARADTGYFHREQTHDISLINQHWGEIRKIIPVEIKSKASNRDKRRYHALIIPGKLRLSIDGVDPRDTVDAFYDLRHGQATTKQSMEIERLSTQLREMLRLYQLGVTPEGLAVHSLTRFHDAKTVSQSFPELMVNHPKIQYKKQT